MKTRMRLNSVSLGSFLEHLLAVEFAHLELAGDWR